MLCEIENDNYGSFKSDNNSKGKQQDTRKRYDILTLVEDAIRNQDSSTTGHYEIKFEKNLYSGGR